MNAVGKPFFMWSLDSLDWKYKDVDLDYKSIMQDNSSVIKDGTIILMHDIHEPSVKAAERIIPELINMGFKLVTVSEMAEAKNVTLQNASYNNFWQDILDQGLVHLFLPVLRCDLLNSHGNNVFRDLQVLHSRLNDVVRQGPKLLRAVARIQLDLKMGHITPSLSWPS